jgi:hypothetical protein
VIQRISLCEIIYLSSFSSLILCVCLCESHAVLLVDEFRCCLVFSFTQDAVHQSLERAALVNMVEGLAQRICLDS